MRDLKSINKIWYIIFICYSSLAILLAVNQLFKIGIFGFLPIDTAYLYYLLMLYMSCAFAFPAHSKSSPNKIPWYDILMFLISKVACGYMAVNAINISLLGWAYQAPLVPTVFSFIILGLRPGFSAQNFRFTDFSVCAVFFSHTSLASHLPGFLQGMQFNILDTARSHAMSLNSIMSVPMNTVGPLLIGSCSSVVVLGETGGGVFFHDIAHALMGRRRGGAR